VDLAALVERIVVSESYPEWALPALQKAVCDAGLSVEVELSDLLKEPEPFVPGEETGL
jgi:hypothetical protein